MPGSVTICVNGTAYAVGGRNGEVNESASTTYTSVPVKVRRRVAARKPYRPEPPTGG